MIITTTDEIKDRKITEVLGLVRCNTVRARNVGRDIVAGLRNMVGGEIQEYSKLLAESKEEAFKRMVQRAEDLGANAVVGDRFATSMVAGGSAEILAYGTSVVVEQK